MNSQNRIHLTITIILFLFSGLPSGISAPVQASFRILDIKAKIFSNENTIKLKDIVSNLKTISNEEKELVITETPLDKNAEYTLVDVAYMLQRYPELHDVKIRGPKSVIIQKKQNLEYINRAKTAVAEYVSSHEPWKDWETDVLFSNDDELRIAKMGEFATVDVVPYDNKSLLGTLAFSLAFHNASDQLMGKVIINPVVLKKISVVVMNANATSGQIIQKNDLKLVPMWLGDQKKNYVTEMSECIGKELAKKMTFGDIVLSSDILNPVCVKKGDIIWVECIHKTMNVRVVAVALQNGRQGDFIRVKNRSSDKEFMVELTGPKEATYHLKG